MSGKELAKKVYRKLFGQKVYVERVTKPYVVNILKEGRFKNKVVIVTGGSGTIGRSVACRLALEGAVVIITGRNASMESWIIWLMLREVVHVTRWPDLTNSPWM